MLKKMQLEWQKVYDQTALLSVCPDQTALLSVCPDQTALLSVCPDQTALLNVCPDQGSHCLLRPICPYSQKFYKIYKGHLNPYLVHLV